MRSVPTHEIIDWVSEYDEFREEHKYMVGPLANLAGIRLVYDGSRLWVIGYPNDIQYFRMLWVSTHLTFSGKLNPEWQRGATPGTNIRAFVESGYKWDYIWRKARQIGQPFTNKNGEPVPCPPNDNGWMKRQLAAAYRATGEEQPKLTHAVKNYRKSYAGAFAETIRDRAYALLFARQEREREAGSGVGLVLRSDANALLDYFNQLFPPGALSSGSRPQIGGNHQGAAQAGRSAAASVDFSGGQGGVGGHEAGKVGAGARRAIG